MGKRLAAAVCALTMVTASCGGHADPATAPSPETAPTAQQSSQTPPAPSGTPNPIVDAMQTQTPTPNASLEVPRPPDPALAELKPPGPVMPADAGRDYGRRPSNLTDDDMDDIAMAAWAVHGFWTLHWSQFFTMNYRAPRVAGLYNGRNPQTTPVCYGAKGAFRLTADNAWYCHGVQDRFVAWDVGLMNRSASIGNAFLYLVVAHEWGHAIAYQLQRGLQFKAGELQADCLAGAALAGAIRDGALKMAPGDVGEFAAGLRSIADKTPWSKTGDHGSAAQRIGSFAIGARDSVWACLPK